MTEAFKIITSDPKVKGILVNIFGGIMRCDVIAEGVIAAVKEVGLQVPLVVRLEGTNVELGKKILNESGLAVIAADDLADAAEKIVEGGEGMIGDAWYRRWSSSLTPTGHAGEAGRRLDLAGIRTVAPADVPARPSETAADRSDWPAMIDGDASRACICGDATDRSDAARPLSDARRSLASTTRYRRRPRSIGAA